MKQNEFALLVGAGAIESVTIYRDAAAGEGWTVYAYGDGVKTRNSIETERGGLRTWSSLDTAHRWIRERGWNGPVQIDEAFGAKAKEAAHRQGDADAKLIAATPRLLAAARAALHYMRLHKYADQAWADDLEAAIAAATTPDA